MQSLSPRFAAIAVNFLGTMIAKSLRFRTGAELSAAVIHIVQRLAPGGLEVLAIELARGIGTASKLLSLEGDSEALIDRWHRLKEQSLDIVGLGKGTGIQPDIVRKAFAAISAIRPHAVITHHIGPLIYGGLAARLARVPFLVHVEHDAWHLGAGRHRWMMRALVGALQPRLVAVSDLGAAEFRKHLPGARIRVIPNGIDLNRFTPHQRDARRRELGLPTGVPIVGNVGRLEHVKGHDVLIDALSHIQQDCRVVIAGDGSLRQNLEARARALGVHDRMLFLGHRDDVARLYPCFDLFVLPSRNEGLSISLLEAQACGVPIVASDVGATREAVCPDTGRLVRADDPRELARNITEAFSDRHFVSPRDFVARRFDFADTLASYRDILELKPC
jgi:glycosyltransferase involved in cell wall biosynthesis